MIRPEQPDFYQLIDGQDEGASSAPELPRIFVPIRRITSGEDDGTLVGMPFRSLEPETSQENAERPTETTQTEQ